MHPFRIAGASLRLPAVCAGGALLVTAGSASAGMMVLQPGTYQLNDHPDGNAQPPVYGLRLDELVDVTDNHDVFTFSFDGRKHEGVGMFLTLDTSEAAGGEFTIRIHGTAFGGLVQNDAYVEANSGLVALDFLYTMVAVADDDDDFVVFAATGTNTGSITADFLGESGIPLFDKANSSGLTFRLGDEFSDDGHRGARGISGWGWLNHGTSNGHVSASVWLFTLTIPTPGALALLSVAMVMFGGSVTRRRRGAA